MCSNQIHTQTEYSLAMILRDTRMNDRLIYINKIKKITTSVN